MRILCVTNMYPTTAEPWFGCFVKEQMDAVRSLGIETTVFQFEGRRDPLEYGRAALRLPALLEREHFDLVHAHYGLSGAVALSQRRLPVVTTFHGSDTGYSRWQGWVSWIVARATVPVFVSSASARRLGLPSAAVIPSAVDVERFVPNDRVKARQALGWDEDGRYVLLPGSRSNRVKRADLFDAAVQEARLSVPDLTPVSLEGFSREQVVDVMNAVDLTLMTSESEGSPVAIKESLACTTPVVSVDVGDVSEVLAGLQGCSIRSREPRDLADGVLAALAAPPSSVLRERALRYSSRRIAERVVAVYESAGRARRT